MKENLLFLIKKTIFIIKNIIKLILIYSFIQAIIQPILYLYPFESKKEKIIEILINKYEDNQCMYYRAKNGYLYVNSVRSFNIFEIRRKIKISENYKSNIDYTCEIGMEDQRKFLLEIENIKAHTK